MGFSHHCTLIPRVDSGCRCPHMALALHFNTVDRIESKTQGRALWVNAAAAPDQHTRGPKAWFWLKQEEELGLQHWAVFSTHSGINWRGNNLLHQEQIEEFMWCKLSFIHVQICLCRTLWKQPQDVDMTPFLWDSYQSVSLLSFRRRPPPPPPPPPP